MLNKQGQGKIDWTDYTWNPISGCLHRCDYCYMHRLVDRFKFDFQPALHQGRLSEPGKLKDPVKIFTGSSGDMWGAWVYRRWIDQVLRVVSMYPRHTFQFLTKNPKRYLEFDLPVNGWYGTTIDGTVRTAYNHEQLLNLKSARPDLITFISFEPLLAPVDVDLKGIDWIIIGANSNQGAVKPQDDWADDLIEQARAINIPVHVKDNYKYHAKIKEMPCTQDRRKAS